MGSRKRRILIFSFFIVLLIVYALPFRVESIHSTQYTTILGNSARATPSVQYYSAYQEIEVLALQVFFYVTLILLYFAKTKIWGVFSIIGATINGLSLFVIHFGITFHLQFFGPKVTMEVGAGFYALCLLCFMLFAFTIITLIQLPSKTPRIVQSDLLDTNF